MAKTNAGAVDHLRDVNSEAPDLAGNVQFHSPPPEHKAIYYVLCLSIPAEGCNEVCYYSFALRPGLRVDSIRRFSTSK